MTNQPLIPESLFAGALVAIAICLIVIVTIAPAQYCLGNGHVCKLLIDHAYRCRGVGFIETTY